MATLLRLRGRRSLSLRAFPPAVLELYHGNVNLMAAAIVPGLRHPPVWVFLVLTKVTSGVGLL